MRPLTNVGNWHSSAFLFLRSALRFAKRASFCLRCWERIILRQKQRPHPAFGKPSSTTRTNTPPCGLPAPKTSLTSSLPRGSTAIPKAVQISYRALWSNLHTLQKVYELKEDSRIFNILTVYHTDGIIQGPILSGFVGGAWYHPFTFAIDRLPLLFDSFYKYQISHFITVPTILRLMYDFGEDFVDCFDYPEFQNAITSAAPFELDLWEAFEQRFATRIVNNYGLTETVAGASYCGPQEDAFRRGSIGIPIDCAFKIVDTNGQPLPYGEEGELLIKGDNLLTSYLNNPAATNAAFTDGWFRTGDTAVQDAEGFYYLRGRIKNLIISGGINIQPEEVNAVLNSHPAVMEAACVGLPDNVFGELPVAAVVLKAGATVTTATLVEHCRQELEENKIPRTIHLLAELPKTGSGKIKYSALKELLLEADPATRPALPFEHNLREAILAAAKSAFKLNTDNVNFAEASTLTVDGWDSLAHLAFITQLEENLNLRFSAKEIMQISSLLDTETILQKKTRP